MSLKLPSAPNAGLFKQGYQTYSNEDGAVMRNIAAVREIANMIRTSIGPCGRTKIVVNHLQKIFLTTDAATILKELEIVHPAAKLVVMASQQQEADMGDATNLVLILAGEFLNQAEGLLRLGLKTTDIIQGYDRAKKEALKVLDTLPIESITDFHTAGELQKAVKSAVASKQFESQDKISELICEAISLTMPKNSLAFNVDNIRVVKVMGASLSSSVVIKGMVFQREPEGSVKSITKAKVGVFTCPIDISQTETKGTVLLHNAKEMMDFTKGEEAQMEESIKTLHDSGLRVVVAGATIGDLAVHYLNKYGILVFRVPSKFDLRRLCSVMGAVPLPRLGAPMPDEMGYIEYVETKEIGGDRVTVFRQNEETQTRTATIVVRGATQNALEDVERTIDDGVGIIKALTKDSKLVAGAGAAETELAAKVIEHGEKTPGVVQHAIKKYGEAFEILPRILAENSGLDPTEIMSLLYSAHSKGSAHDGVDVDEVSEHGVIDAKERGIYDVYAAKRSAIELATEVACTILSVDQIIMAKRAGGPVMPQQKSIGNWDQDD